MTQRIFVSALVAGAVAGLIAAVLQFLFVIPLLLEGELYETGARVHFADGAAESESGAPALEWDFQRHSLTVAFSMITWIAFSLVLTALMALRARSGWAITVESGALWGLMAFLAVQLAPAAGLPPELPGTAAADVTDRYVWWIGTIVAAGLALWLLTNKLNAASVALAIALLVAPHVIGAPHLDRYYGVAPPELSAHFVTRSLAVTAVVWTVMGAVIGWVWQRDGEG